MKGGFGAGMGPGVRQLGVVVAIVAVQAGFILWVSEREVVARRDSVPVSGMRLGERRDQVTIADPALLALPSGNSFAGEGWRQASDPRYESQPWDEPQRWLAAREAPLGRLFLEARRPEIGRGLTAEKPVPELARREVGTVRLAGGTTVELEGGFGGMELMEPVKAPSVTHSNILGETVVQVVVHPEGQVLSAIVLKSSGLRSVDGEALGLARRARFRPKRVGDMEGGGVEVELERSLVVGRMIFRWWTAVGSGVTGGGGM
jgi:TonB family protein